MSQPTEPGLPERCSFCGKSADKVPRLVYAQPSPAMPRVAICSQCIKLYHALNAAEAPDAS